MQTASKLPNHMKRKTAEEIEPEKQQAMLPDYRTSNNNHPQISV